MCPGHGQFLNIVKLREREGQRVDLGNQLSIVDCRLSISISLKLYIKFGCHPPPPTHLPPGSLLISRIKLINGPGEVGRGIKRRCVGSI